MTDTVSYETWMATVRECNEAKEEVRRLREALEHVAKMYASPDSVGNVLAIDYARRLAQDAVAQAPPSRPVTAGREKIARIIEPEAFSDVDAANDPAVEGSESARNFIRQHRKPKIDAALAKADAILALGPTVSPHEPAPVRQISVGVMDNLLSRLDQGAAYQGYPEGFGFSWQSLARDAAIVIRRLRALAPKGAA